MNIPDNIIQQRLYNVWYIWGSGKTTAANALAKRHNAYVYHTDDSRVRHFKAASPEYQPEMCRYVPDFWALEQEDALQWEKAIVHEMTPMIVTDLLILSAQYERVICEGDIDIDAIIPILPEGHAVTIVNRGGAYDFFDRPEQQHLLDEIHSRNISEQEKQGLIENAYRIVGNAGQRSIDEALVPREARLYGIREVVRDDQTTVEETVSQIEEYWDWN